jgi:hypothetical protein
MPGCLVSEEGVYKILQWQKRGKYTVVLIHDGLLLLSLLFIFVRTLSVQGQGHYSHFRDKGTETQAG